MKKDAYYFPHFSNARHDRKIKRVLKELGIEGYGIYFMLLEVLREQQDFKYPLSDLDLLSDEFHTSLQKVEAVLKRYELFQIDEQQNFFSIKQIYYLQPYIEKSQRARDAANIKWNRLKENANAYANAEQMQCVSNASKVKESKVKESKVKDKLIIESKDIFREFKHLKMTNAENQKLLNLGYSQSDIIRTLESIENYKKNTNYVSMYLTAKKWLENENKGVKEGAVLHNLKQNQRLMDELNNF